MKQSNITPTPVVTLIKLTIGRWWMQKQMKWHFIKRIWKGK